MPKMYKWRVVGKVEINPITDHNDLGHDDISDTKVIETIHDKEKNNG